MSSQPILNAPAPPWSEEGLSWVFPELNIFCSRSISGYSCHLLRVHPRSRRIPLLLETRIFLFTISAFHERLVAERESHSHRCFLIRNSKYLSLLHFIFIVFVRSAVAHYLAPIALARFSNRNIANSTHRTITTILKRIIRSRSQANEEIAGGKSSASVGAKPATLPPTLWNHQPGGKRTSGGSSGTGSAFSLEVAIPEGPREGGKQAGVVFFEYVATGAVGMNSFGLSTHGAGARDSSGC
jgi:hypothetical protein